MTERPLEKGNQGWQLIETAPKDRKVLLAEPIEGSSRNEYRIYSAEWANGDWADGANLYAGDPTHWRDMIEEPSHV